MFPYWKQCRAILLSDKENGGCSMIYLITFLFTAGIFCHEAFKQQRKSRLEQAWKKADSQFTVLIRRLESADSEEEIHLLIDLILMNVNDIKNTIDSSGFDDIPACYYKPDSVSTDFNLFDIGELSILRDYFLNRLPVNCNRHSLKVI